MPKIYDNIDNHLTKGLNDTLESSLRADFCVGYFNLRGWKQVAETIDNLEGKLVMEGKDDVHRICRLLVGMQKMPIDILRDYFSHFEDNIIDQKEALVLKKRLAQEFKDQLTIGTPTDQDERALRKLSQQMKDRKVVVKLHLRYTLHAKLYLAYSDDKRVPVVGFLGSSNLTLAGLAKQGELNIDVMDQDAANKLALWFDDRWKDRWCLDITEELIEIIDTSWAADKLNSPYHIYLKIAYHLSREARAGINEFKLPKIFQKELLEFQQKAVLVAAHHLHKRGGVLIGDVVGLGKTITATALAKLFEDDFFVETLIICPKNLVEMWEDYAHKYQLRAKVIPQSQVQTKLPNLRRYRLVIVDESHNLRNDQGSRYRAIKSYLEENDSKVILLSATPYNKTYLDLSNQLRLFISDDKDLGISPEEYIKHIGGQVQFSSQHTETFIRSIKAFEKSPFADDWRELMRLYLVRRTRSFIKNNYAETDPINNRKFLTFSDGSKSYFPDRIPQRVLYEFDPNNKSDIYANLYSTSVVETINGLELPRYGLQAYLISKPLLKATKEEEMLMQNLSRAGRRLMGFARTNLFKRLESSGYSFLLSLSRHILRNYLFVYAVQNHLPIPIGKNISQNLDEYLEDSDTDNDGEGSNLLNLILKEETYLKKAEELYKLFTSENFKKRFEWIRSEFFSNTLSVNLINDSKEIIKILSLGKDWNPDQDKQLNALYDLLTITHGKEKVLVFTQFADTAYYLTEQLKKRGIKKLESVTGADENPTGLAQRFSPFSNNKADLIKEGQELRVLITTDVLSEGQNLQDAHIILNYDLPWAIIRLIQRAGRVDRIGQKAEKIICYSFLPEDGIEAIINLRRRLTQRIEENANVVGSDETFFDGDPINLTDLYNEKSGILDGEDDDTEVDLASLAYQIWKNATDADPELNKIIPDLPNVIYATKHNEDAPEKEGVIVYTRTSEENDVLAWMNNKGEIITQSQHTILKVAQCTPDTEPKYKLENHHELVKKGIDFIRDEEKNTGGSLGKKTGVKYRVYMRLDRYCKEYEGTLFVNEQLKKAVDDIYKYPLKEFARETLNRQLKSGIADDQLGALVISLREEDKLAIVNEDEQPNREPQIICSMGLKNS
ncbi:NgoFVII family restriction endonuclease [Pedobacter changchengzhani]|uniref:NgoFVII family restriction endonuclease n=1 Tax=Pedobacter changchengzhani TaxID=2529274 RepID=A0A4R5MLX6_9SPHI|nr:helicase-related protein [Pedobacter changchengzhani]TDG36684.1 NgoFVII family restriction endonuclease [Pedobacter changchengzhani]